MLDLMSTSVCQLFMLQINHLLKINKKLFKDNILTYFSPLVLPSCIYCCYCELQFLYWHLNEYPLREGFYSSSLAYFAQSLEFNSKLDKKSFLIPLSSSEPRSYPTSSYHFEKTSMPNLTEKSIPTVLFTKFYLLKYHIITEYSFHLGFWTLKKQQLF